VRDALDTIEPTAVAKNVTVRADPVQGFRM